MKIQASNARQYLNHIKTLAQISNASEYEAEQFYKILRRIEARANRITTQECNGTIDPDKSAKQLNNIKKQVKKLLPGVNDFFINGDPRGYALKIKTETTKTLYPELHQDWGGYGILAPEF